MSRSDIILKLTVGKDKRTVAPVETGGHISYFLRTFGAKLKDALKFNLLYSAIFALPLLFSAFALPIILNKMVFDGKNFISNFAIGFPGVADDVNASISELFYNFRIILFPCLIFSIFVAFVGMSGLFHCARGLMWDEKVKTASFFRGIKYLWKPFMLTGAIVAALSAAIMYAVGWHFELMLTNAANAGSWIVFILSLLAGLALVCVLIVLLPTFACYDFKFKDALFNSFKFFALMPVPNIVLGVLSIGILLLSAIGNVLMVLIGGLLLFLGFSFYAMMWTTYGQYLFDAFIVPQVDEEGNRKADVVKKLQNKAAGKKGEGDQKPQYAEKTRGNNKKPANNYNSSYKRKPNDAQNKSKGKK